MADSEALDSWIRGGINLGVEAFHDLLGTVGFARGRVAGNQEKLLLLSVFGYDMSYRAKCQ